MRNASALALLLALLCVPVAALAQGIPALGISNMTFDRDEVQQMLVEAGASEVTAMSILEAYPADYEFTEEEVRELLKSIPQEELLEEYKERKLRAEQERRRRLPPGRALGPEARAARRPLAPGGPPGVEPEGLEPLAPFGYEVFAYSPLEFAPSEDIPVGPDYVLGPGDELFIALWGAVEKNYKTIVNREGNIVLPELGVVHASGIALASFEKLLKRRFSAVYSDFSMDVSLGKLRTIQVFVVGDVVRPGAYTISPVSTVFNALYYAGGPSARGSLRKVMVYRGRELIATVDLYDYLLRGDSSGDIRLRSGDTVFVPTVGPRVRVRGMVKRPAVYELKGGETVRDVIQTAGGFTADAYRHRVDVMRVDSERGLAAIAVKMSDGADSLSWTPGPWADADEVLAADGDEITVYSVWHVNPKEFVSVEGMVQYPGTHPLYPGMRVSDLVFKAGGLLDQAYLLRAEISRIVEEPEKAGYVSDLIFVNLEETLREPGSEGDVVLEPGDRLFVRKIPGWRPQELVKIGGEVRFPGTYSLRTKEERLSAVLQRAGGLTPEAFPKGGTIYRKNEGRVIVDISKALEKPGSNDDLVLVDGDSVYIPIYPNTIKVEGAVGRPGSIVFERGKTADYYIEKTGGYLERANRGSVRIVRLDGSTEKAHKRFWFDPEVKPGNKIVVEMKREERGINWRAAVRDATTILASMATTIYIISQIN